MCRASHQFDPLCHLNNIHHDSCLTGYKSSREALAHYHGDVNAKYKASTYGVIALYWDVVRRETVKEGAVIETLPLPTPH